MPAKVNLTTEQNACGQDAAQQIGGDAHAIWDLPGRVTQILNLLPVAVYVCDKEGRILYRNRACLEL